MPWDLLPSMNFGSKSSSYYATYTPGNWGAFKNPYEATLNKQGGASSFASFYCHLLLDEALCGMLQRYKSSDLGTKR